MKNSRSILWITLLFGVLLAQTALARPLYLKDGSVIQAQQIWQEDDRVYVLLNRDSLIFFYPEEVLMKKTFSPHASRASAAKKKAAPAVTRVQSVQPPPPTPVKPPATVAAKAPSVGATTPAPATKTTPVATTAKTPSAVPAPPPQMNKPAASTPQPPAAKPAAPAAATTVQPQTKPTPAPSVQPTAPQTKGVPVAVAPPAPVAPAKPLPPKTQQSAKPQPPKSQPSAEQLMEAGGGAAALAFLGGIAGVCLVLIASMWKIFVKAGEAGWKCLIPIYNFLVLLRIAGCPTWWFFMMFIPIANLWYGVLMHLRLAEKFGKSHLFGFGLCFLGFVFFPILGFGSALYQYPQNDAFTFDENWGETPH